MGAFPERILLATDGSPDAALALRAAVDISTKEGTELHVVHAWRAFPPFSHPGIALATDSGLLEREARTILLERLDEVEASGGFAAGAHLGRGHPVEVICDLVEQLRVGLVVMGSRGLGPVRRLLTGSISEGVVALAACPVLVVRSGSGKWPPSRIVVGDDSSASARRAGELAMNLGEIFGAEVLLVRACPVVMTVSEAVRLSRGREPEDLLRCHEFLLWCRAKRLEEKLGCRPRIRVREGEAASIILDAAGEREPSLIAVGRRGLGTIDRLRIGSVSTRVLRAARGPVLVCPG